MDGEPTLVVLLQGRGIAASDPLPFIELRQLAATPARRRTGKVVVARDQDRNAVLHTARQGHENTQ